MDSLHEICNTGNTYINIYIFLMHGVLLSCLFMSSESLWYPQRKYYCFTGHQLFAYPFIQMISNVDNALMKFDHFNPLAPGRSECISKNVIFNRVLLIGIFRSSHDNALRWMSWDLPDDKSRLVQVMACCRQATSHYLSQSWLSSLSPYGVTRPQWVKQLAIHRESIMGNVFMRFDHHEQLVCMVCVGVYILLPEQALRLQKYLSWNGSTWADWVMASRWSPAQERNHLIKISLPPQCIAVMSHEHHGMSYHWWLDCLFNSV